MMKQEKQYLYLMDYMPDHIDQCKEPFAILIPLYKANYIFYHTERDKEEQMFAKLLTTEESADATYHTHPTNFATSITEFKRRFHIRSFFSQDKMANCRQFWLEKVDNSLKYPHKWIARRTGLE